MFIHLKKIYTIVATLFCINIQFAQNSSDYKILLKTNDEKLKFQNLPINNGPLHKNYDLTVNKENHRYIFTGDFINGELLYSSQFYSGIKLNYDIYEDELVFQPDQENSAIKINLIKKNVISFEINNIKFINLNSQLPDNFSKGFYELKTSTKKGILYIKHLKDRKEVIVENRNLVEYFYKKSYIVYYSNLYYQIKSKKDLIKIYPEQKKIINTFYSNNEKLEKVNKDLFFSNLLKQLSQ